MGSAQGQVSSELEQASAAPGFGEHTPLSEKLLGMAIRAQNFTGSTGVAIALTEGQEMVCRANWGTSAPEVGAKLSIEHSFTGLCVRTGAAVRCDEAETDPRVDAEACQALGVSAIAAAPLRRGPKVIGVIAAFSDTPRAFTDKHLRILATISDVIVELLDDRHPVQPLPQIVETAPDPAPAAGIAQTSVAPLVDKASVATTMLEEPAAPLAQGDLVAVPIATAASAQPEPPVDAAPAAAAEAVPDVLQPPNPEPAAPPVSASFNAPAAAAPAHTPGRATPRGHAWDRSVAPHKKDEVLPVAMNSGPPPQQRKTGFARDTTLPLQPAKTALAGDAGPHAVHAREVSRPAPAPVPDSVADLRFSGFEDDAGTARRWLLPAAILAILAVIAFAAWRLQVARGASKAMAVPTAQVPEPAAAPAPQPEQAQGMVPALLVERVEPLYPETARRLGISGKVAVKATITKTGTVRNVLWVSGNDLFRDSAITAVKQWRYKPATSNGQPVESDDEIILFFALF
jgi:TonB family protein